MMLSQAQHMYAPSNSAFNILHLHALKTSHLQLLMTQPLANIK